MDLFEYMDYREFLRDFYRQQKARSPSYSYRVFARKARLASPNYLKLVMDNKRRITDKNLAQFERGLGLKPPESEYFKTLVLYQDSSESVTKSEYLRELMRIRKKNLCLAKEITQDQSEFLKEWQHSVIREMVTLKGFIPDPDWIANRLRNRITPDEARASLGLLEKLGFLTKEQDKYQLAQPLMSSSDEIPSLLLRNFHRQFVELGLSSLFKDSIERRETGGVTLSVSKAQINEIKHSIKRFRKELNRVFSCDAGGDEVYHIIINFFPLTEKKGSS